MRGDIIEVHGIMDSIEKVNLALLFIVPYN